MKKQVLFLGIIILLLISPLILAADNETNTTPDETSKVDLSQIDKAYKCLEDKVKDKCSTSLVDNVFTLLAIKKCGEEVEAESSNDECWSKASCNIKTTAQSVLALSKAGYKTSKAEDWLSNQNSTPDDIDWFLEIESPVETTCTIKYDSKDYFVNIGTDKKISSSAGSCLSLYTGDYWLRVSPSCYAKEFEVSCDESFLTTLLFKKKTSSTIHVSETTQSSSAEGTTKEKVMSLCFSTTATCDYEGSLWATLVLENLGYEVSSFIPYLVTMSDENSKYLPESFLYALTGYTDFRSDLLLKQKKQYWDESGDKFYDTALALYPFTHEDLTEKDNSKKWLLEIQGNDGCWDSGKIKSNAFILASIWPRGGYTSSQGGSNADNDVKADCITSGYYCTSSIDCEGNILSAYTCSGVSKCCDKATTLKLCLDQGGEICTSSESCAGGTIVNSVDTNSGGTCCVGGRCQKQEVTDQADCTSSGGTCRPYGCDSGEEESFTSSCDYGDSCCISPSKEGTAWWIWLLLVLIILIIVAIIFRDRLKVYYHKTKFKFGNSNSGPKAPPSIFPASPRTSGYPQRIGTPRRILPPSASHNPIRQPPAKRPSEVDDVLRKLKEMGK